jgi:hypothetical protein
MLRDLRSLKNICLPSLFVCLFGLFGLHEYRPFADLGIWATPRARGVGLITT